MNAVQVLVLTMNKEGVKIATKAVHHSYPNWHFTVLRELPDGYDSTYDMVVFDAVNLSENIYLCIDLYDNHSKWVLVVPENTVDGVSLRALLHGFSGSISVSREGMLSVMEPLKRIQAGELVFDSTVMSDAVKFLIESRRCGSGRLIPDGLKYGLTHREKDIFNLLILGLKNREISDNLCISEHTVKGHVTNIYKKIGVKNRTALFAIN